MFLTIGAQIKNLDDQRFQSYSVGKVVKIGFEFDLQFGEVKVQFSRCIGKNYEFMPDCTYQWSQYNSLGNEMLSISQFYTDKNPAFYRNQTKNIWLTLFFYISTVLYVPPCSWKTKHWL